MNQCIPTATGEKIIETMIELGRCSKLHRIIVAGSKSLSHMFELHSRGYNRVVTAACYGLRSGRYDVGFLDWRRQQIKALEAKLNGLAPLLAPTSVVVIWLDGSERAEHRKLNSILERLGFRVEAGTCGKDGFGISARRRDASQQALAA